MRYWQIIIIIFITLLLLKFIQSDARAEENVTPTPTVSENGLTTYGLGLEDFIGGLLSNLKKNKIDKLNEITSQSLPPDTQISPVRQVTTAPVKTNTLNAEANTKSQDTNPIYDAASGYVVNNALRKSSNFTPVTSDISGFLANFVKIITDLMGITKVGDQNATEMYQAYNPEGLTPNQQIQAKDTVKAGQGTTLGNNNVLGLEDATKTNATNPMSEILPALWCEGLPPGSCSDNKINWAD